MEIVKMKIADIKIADYNPRLDLKPGDLEYEKIKRSIQEFSLVEPLVWNKRTKRLVGGHQRLKVLKELGHEAVEVSVVDLPEDKEKALNVALNKVQGEWDAGKLHELLSGMEDADLKAAGFTGEEIEDLLIEMADETFDEFQKKQQAKEARQTLKERFLVPPFSILDTRKGRWMKRKRAWRSLGIKSELGRGEDGDITRKGLTFTHGAQPPEVYDYKVHIEEQLGRELSWQEFAEKCPEKLLLPGTSIFDPVLTEICYRWFAPKGGHILDPFAGGSVRGIVAGVLGFKYTGIDLRPEQLKANEEQAESIKPKVGPHWICGDSRDMPKLLRGRDDFDMVFTCPPYFDLEVYSDNENDLSNAGTYEDFIIAYNDIIKKSISKLSNNRFAVFVVSEIRDRKGFYRNLIRDTVNALEAAGARFYNEIILINTVGSLTVRARQPFEKYRKTGRQHQNVLVFYKGDMLTADQAAEKINEEFKRGRKQREQYEKALVFYKGDPGAIPETIGLFEMSDDELAEYIETELESSLFE